MQATIMTPTLAKSVRQEHNTPSYVYSEKLIREAANKALNFPHAFGLTVRFAMKANPNRTIIRLFNQMGIHIDASSGYEAIRAINAGIPGSHIQLSGQQLPNDLRSLVQEGVQFVACSLHQLEAYGQLFPHTKVGVRINPGVGSGAFKKIDTGGPTSSFGIWHEQSSQIQTIAQKYQLTINKIHIHIGSENTPDARASAAQDARQLLEVFSEVEILNMGGGFKVAIMPYEKDADMQGIGLAVKQSLEKFYAETGRKIHLEIEPGKYLIMNTCTVVAEVIDTVNTGTEGYNFIKLNTGMTELPRFAMYGIQQPIHILSETQEREESVVVGHCCESGDLLTPMLYQSEQVEPILLPKAQVGDLVAIQSCGAYNSSMAMKHYNSYPEAAELMIRSNGEIVCIRKRQEITHVWANEQEVRI